MKFCPNCREDFVATLEIKLGEIGENWQPAKFYCSEIKLVYSIRHARPGTLNCTNHVFNIFAVNVNSTSFIKKKKLSTFDFVVISVSISISVIVSVVIFRVKSIFKMKYFEEMCVLQ